SVGVIIEAIVARLTLGGLQCAIATAWPQGASVGAAVVLPVIACGTKVTLFKGVHVAVAAEWPQLTRKRAATKGRVLRIAIKSKVDAVVALLVVARVDQAVTTVGLIGASGSVTVDVFGFTCDKTLTMLLTVAYSVATEGRQLTIEAAVVQSVSIVDEGLARIGRAALREVVPVADFWTTHDAVAAVADAGAIETLTVAAVVDAVVADLTGWLQDVVAAVSWQIATGSAESASCAVGV